jgi:hypothetical protein
MAPVALQNDQLIAEHRILSFKPAFRLEGKAKIHITKRSSPIIRSV